MILLQVFMRRGFEKSARDCDETIISVDDDHATLRCLVLGSLTNTTHTMKPPPSEDDISARVFAELESAHETCNEIRSCYLLKPQEGVRRCYPVVRSIIHG